MTPHEPAPSRLLLVTAGLARWLLRLLVAAWLLFALALGVLHGWIVPRIDHFRPQLEQQASRVLGVTVRIDEIQARSEGLFPSFELNNVRLLDAGGREALRLPRVVLSVSPRSVFDLGFEQLYIDKPELDIRRDAQGRITVAGLDFSKGGGDSHEAADWFFSQREFAIRGGTLRWTDELRHAGTLALADVDIVVRNRTRRHAIRIDATPPEAWGQRFTLSGQFRQPLLVRRNGDWQQWDGQVHGDFSRVDVSQLKLHADIGGADLRQGLGALRFWVDMKHGEVTGATADVALAAVDVKLGPDLEPLTLSALSGRLGGRRLPGGFEFSTSQLQFDTADGLRWPGGNLFLRYAEPPKGTPAGELRADRLDLAALAQIANRLPLAPAVHEVLAQHAPRGLVDSVQAHWSGPPTAPTRYDAKGRVTGLEIASSAQNGHGTPGVRGASFDFEFDQDGGKTSVAIAQGALTLPGVFEEPVVPVDRLSASARWKREGEKLSVDVSELRFANVDAEGEARAHWQTSDPARSSSRSRFPGVLDLTGTLSRGDGTRVWRYLPAHLPQRIRDYVHEGVTAGTVSDVKFLVKGDLHDMPYKDPKLGEFRIAGRMHGVDFNYVPKVVAPKGELPWPAIVGIEGDIVFDRLAMQIKNTTARVQGTAGLVVPRVEASIPDLAHDATVLVDSTLRGPLADALKVVASSPLSRMVGPALAQATATGNADVALKLRLPLHQLASSKVDGAVALAGNDLQFTPETPRLARARGTVTFSETGFAVAGGQATMLGGDVRIEGGSRGSGADALVQLRAQGTATADGLRQARELGFVSRLAQAASGSAAYSATLAFRHGVPEINVSSSLQGLALALPAPLAKPAESSLPLRFENTVVRDSNAKALSDQLVLELGRVLLVNYLRDLSGREPRVVRGGIGVGLGPGESAPLPESGVAANINFATLDIDAWEDALTNAAGAGIAGMAARPAANATAAPSAAAADTSAVQDYLPTQIAVRARELTVQGRKLSNVVAGGSRDGSVWRANLDANELNGYVEYRQANAQTAGGRVYARLARLAIAQSATREVEAILDEQPSSIPGLDIVVDDFELAGKHLGRLEIDAVNRSANAREGATREWRLNKLNFTTPDAILTATGNWTGIAATPGARTRTERRRTVMNFRLDIANAGDLLARFGMKDVIRRGKGRMEGQVAWLGSPLALDYPSLAGQFAVNVEEGQFLKADPGLAKLLGVLSLQTLPRRLTLDFRDVFSEGFSFDFIRGDVKIDQGVATTNNLQMKGVNAAVLMEGKANIATETQDIRVVVVPEINAGTASLVATAINPAIGLGTFLAQYLLRRPLAQAATQEFHVDGTWSDPRVTRVPRRAPVPETPADTAANEDKPAAKGATP